MTTSKWRDPWLWQSVIVYSCVFVTSLSYMTNILVPGMLSEMLRGRSEFPLTGDSSSQNIELTADVARVKSYYDGMNSLLGVIFVPIFGAMSDVYGRRKVMLFSLVGCMCCVFLNYVAYSLDWLWLFFVSNAAGAMRDGVQVCSLAYMSDLCQAQSSDVRSFRFGLILAMYQIGMLVGSPLFGYLANFPIIISYIFTLCIILIMFIIAAIFLKDLPKAKKISDVTSEEPPQKITCASINPFRFFHLLFNGRYLTVLVISYTLIFLGISDVIATALQVTEYRYHWTPFQYGIQASISMAVGALVQALGLKVTLRCFGENIVNVTSLFFFSTLHVLMGLAWQGWMYFAGNIISQFGLLVIPALQAQISRGVPDDQQAAGLGVLSSLTNIAMFVGSLLMGNCFAYFISKDAFIRIPGIPFLIGALCFFIGATALWLNYATFKKPIAEKTDNRKSMTFETMDENTPLTISVN